jgi:1-phosphofructokinase
MMGALAAARAQGTAWHESLRIGAAAGAVNFLRRGLGTGRRADVEALVSHVELRPA